MSLQFYFGGSGAGKSRKLYEDIIDWSLKEPEQRFLILVPDQFTMQTQMDLVRAHPRHGIMNIDILSFGRLTHRIFEEVGGEKRTVLDDTGKSLILRKVAADYRESLPYIGSNLKKQGYIHEVKSSISEFMQYGIGDRELKELLAGTKDRPPLHGKLKDLHTVYRGFMEYIKGRFITTEETLDLLREQLKESGIVRGSVVAFDGFTGFTPVQYRLLQELMRLADRMIVTCTLDGREDPYEQKGEQELFHLSRKTVKDLCKLAEEAGVSKEKDIIISGTPSPRFLGNPEMAHLERHIFRFPVTEYEEAPGRLILRSASGIEEEVRQAAMEIRRLVTEEGYQYRDIAMITGDIKGYARYVEQEGRRYEIPVYLDQTHGILLNPMTEFIRSALKVVTEGFSYEAVLHYMRSGFADFTMEETDYLENYVLALGIKGKRRYGSMFTRRLSGWEEEEGAERLNQLNEIRERMLYQLEPLLSVQDRAGELVKGLYRFLIRGEAQRKLLAYEKEFREKGNREKEREYAQIYRLVMELLEQIHGLLEQEEMTMEEFADILDAGFAEIEVGSIPQNIDRVVVGDMERTRLRQVKVLFFLGVNDGNIPKGGSMGGIISDLEREYLQRLSFELSPTPRQKIYIQRLYLYMNMTKPSELLYLSYAGTDAEGKSLRPAYLVDTLRKLFPSLTVSRPEIEPELEQILVMEDVMEGFIEKLGRYGEGILQKEEKALLYSYYQILREDGTYWEKAEEAVDAAFTVYKNHPLKAEIARALYGTLLMGSASRLEQYAACAYSHFLKYGLSLKEREEYTLGQMDVGNVFHGVLELFSGELEQSPWTWFDFPEEEGAAMVKKALKQYAASYGETILYSTARNEYLVERMERILVRTVTTVREQLRQGVFAPKRFELSFEQVGSLEAVNIALSDREKVKLTGRIDRVDTYEDEDHVYVKVIDYKSGSRKFDLAALYHGLQLQLVIYMNTALEMEQKTHPGKKAVPAALLYYHVADPMIQEDRDLDPEELNRRILGELRMDGVVNEKEGVVSLLDREFTDQSFVIPVQRKKDGSYSARSSLLGEEDFALLSRFVTGKIRQFGQEILKGNKDVRPYEQGERTACAYCTYKGVCSFDESLPGYEKKVIPSMDKEEVIRRMKEETGEGGQD